MKAASVLLIPLFLLSACGRDPAPPPASGQPVPAGTPADSNAAAPAAGTQGFDINTVAISDAPLGEFPFIQLPDGYQAIKVIEKRFERFPFYTGDRVDDLRRVAGDDADNEEYQRQHRPQRDERKAEPLDDEGGHAASALSA